LPAISPDAGSVPHSSVSARWSGRAPRDYRSRNPADQPAREDRRYGLKRQVHADRDQHRGARAAKNQRHSERCADPQQSPGHLAAHNALRELCHQPRLRRRQRAPADAAGIEVRLVQHQDQGNDQECRRDKTGSALLGKMPGR
jgi:hypothetical protein